MAEEGECPICHCAMVLPTEVPDCKHKFCFLCLKGAYNMSNGKCPMCRGDIDFGVFEQPRRRISVLSVVDPEQENVDDNTEKRYWLYEGGHGWWRFDPRVERDLENSYSSGSTEVEICICGFTYIIDFALMIQHRKNDSTHGSRKLKRVSAAQIRRLNVKGVAGVLTRRMQCEQQPAIPLTPEQQGSDSGLLMNELLKDAFAATVSRDYEKAVSIIRNAVATEEAFGVEDLELIDHVYACILNTSHYDESVIEVCWEWIEALERVPRVKDPRVISSSQLSIYYAYHTICRVQERLPRRGNHSQMRKDTWKRVKASFQYLWSNASQFWKPYELDRLDILCSWSYLALQYSDVCEEDILQLIETAKDHAQHILSTTIVVENAHQAGQRISTIERNLRDTKAITDKMARRMNGSDLSVVPNDDCDILSIKKLKTECV